MVDRNSRIREVIATSKSPKRDRFRKHRRNIHVLACVILHMGYRGGPMALSNQEKCVRIRYHSISQNHINPRIQSVLIGTREGSSHVTRIVVIRGISALNTSGTAASIVSEAYYLPKC